MSKHTKEPQLIRTALHPNGSPVPYCLPDEWIECYCEEEGWHVRIREKVKKFERRYVAGPMTQTDAEEMAREHNAPIFREAARQIVAHLTAYYALPKDAQ